MDGRLPMAVISWLCALIFFAIGLVALGMRTPMHFWSGTTVKPEQIADIPAYNRANGIMWILYGLSYVLAGALSLLWNPVAGGMVLAAACLPGLGLLIIVYTRIYRKYKA